MKKYFFILILFLLIHGARAQSVTDELKNMVIASFTYYPKFDELKKMIERDSSKVALAKSYRSPEFSGTASYNYVDPVNEISLPFGTISINPDHNYNVTLGGRYLLYDFGVIRQNIEKAKLQLSLSKLNATAAKHQIAYQVTTSYYNTIYIKEAIGIQDSILIFLNKTLADVKIKVKLGESLSFDALTIQASIDQELNRKTDLENNLQKMQILLRYLCGNATINGSGFDFDIPVALPEELLAAAHSKNYDFLIQDEKMKLAQAEKESAALINKPTLLLSAATGYRNGFAPHINTFTYNYTAGVTLQVPIYSGNRAKRSISVAQGALAVEKSAAATLDSAFKKDAAQVMADIHAANTRLGNTYGQIKMATEAKRLAYARFQNGVGTNLDLINANTNLQKALLARLQYAYQLCLACVELARLLGVRFWEN